MGSAMVGTRDGERDDGERDGAARIVCGGAGLPVRFQYWASICNSATRGGDDVSEPRTLCIIGDCGGVRSGVGGRGRGIEAKMGIWAASLSARRTASEEEDIPIDTSAMGGGNLQNAIGIPCDRQIGHSLIRSRLATAASSVSSWFPRIWSAPIVRINESR